MNDALPSRFSPGPNDIFYGWWILLACFIISVITGAVTFFGFTAFFDPLVKEFGWSYTQVSFALSLRGIEMSLLSPVVGFLVDRCGSRRLALWGVITVGIGFIMLSFTRTLWMFYASIILIAFGGGGCTGVVLMHVIANWFQSKVGLALGILTSGFGASGFGFSPAQTGSALTGISTTPPGSGWRQLSCSSLVQDFSSHSLTPPKRHSDG